MKLTLKQLIKSSQALNNLGEDKTLDVKLKYSIARNIRLIQSELVEYEKSRVDLIKNKYGIEKDDGNFEVPPKKTTALVVEQDGVKDNVLIVDTTNARVGMGIQPLYAYHIYGDTQNIVLQSNSTSTDTHPAKLIFYRSNGATPLSAYEQLGEIQFWGNYGGGPVGAATITVQSANKGSWGAGDNRAAFMVFATQRRYSEGLLERLRISEDGYVGIGTIIAGVGVTYQKLNVNGSQLFVGADSTQESPMMQIVPSYVVNIHASYTTRTIFSQWAIAGAQEIMRFESGASPMFGVFGSAQALPAAYTQTYATASRIVNPTATAPLTTLGAGADIASMADLNILRLDMLMAFQILNSQIDDSQGYGLAQ